MIAGPTSFVLEPIHRSPGRFVRGAGGGLVANLKLRRDDADEPAPSPAQGVPFASEPRLAPEECQTDLTIRAAEETLERMARQLKNLRQLMGDVVDGPDGPRAA